MMKKTMKQLVKNIYYALATHVIRVAVREQGLSELYHELERAVPDIRDQYTGFALDTEYLKVNVRAEHSFQISLVEKAFGLLDHREHDTLRIMDIGDSSGTHLRYLKSLFGEDIDSMSVNLDKVAVEKIRKKGLKALHMRAEDLGKSLKTKPDILLSFETLEHLHDPCSFLKAMSETSCEYFVITVPYVRASRAGLSRIRRGVKEKHNAENTHIFELCPEDWELLFKHCGWEVVYRRVYLQYPLKHPLRVFSYFFRKLDFEGFYGVILKPNPEWKDLYTSW